MISHIVLTSALFTVHEMLKTARGYYYLGCVS